jgi:hypothetical protein
LGFVTSAFSTSPPLTFAALATPAVNMSAWPGPEGTASSSVCTKLPIQAILCSTAG